MLRNRVVIAIAAVAVFMFGCAIPKCRASEKDIAVVVVPVAGVSVPVVFGPAERSHVGMGYYTENVEPAQSLGDATFAVFKLLLPGRERVEDPKMKPFIRPHLVELRLGAPAPAHEMPILVAVWDESGKGNAEYLALAKYSPPMGDEKPQFLRWVTFAIKGGELPMMEVDISVIFELIPELEEN